MTHIIDRILRLVMPLATPTYAEAAYFIRRPEAIALARYLVYRGMLADGGFRMTRRHNREVAVFHLISTTKDIMDNVIEALGKAYAVLYCKQYTLRN